MWKQAENIFDYRITLGKYCNSCGFRGEQPGSLERESGWCTKALFLLLVYINFK